MKDIRICAIVTGKTIGEFLKNLEATQKIADLVELRVDYIDGLSVSDVDLIKKESYGADYKSAPAESKYIFTCRKKEEGGFFRGKESERVKILKKAIESGFDYVDVELAAVERGDYKDCFAALAMTTKKRAKIILSFHDFERTPTLAELEEIKKQMKKYNGDIMKFATMVKDDGDVKVLYKFLLDKQDDEEMIVVGMGEKGRMTRIIAPLFGSYLTYASTGYSESAPGQIEVGELKGLYDKLRVENYK